MSITYAQLRDARPHKWREAAEEWGSLAHYALNSARDVRHQGSGPLAENWTDEVGRSAAAKFEKLANQLESGYDVMLGVKMVLEGVQESLALAQSTLDRAVDIAREHDIELDSDGRPLAPFSPGKPHTGVTAPDTGAAARDQVTELRDQALRQADEADSRAKTELARLARGVHITDPDKALDAQESASHTESDILDATIPKGEDAGTVRNWWAGLSGKQRHDLMLADPVALSKLDGLPEETQREMRGPDGKFDRVKMVEYAQDNWNKDDPTDFGNNCTNFVSEAPLHAGMERKMGFWSGVGGDDDWGKESGVGNDWWDSRMYYSDSWGSAENNQNFMLRHGGEEVAGGDARPGDIVYYEQQGPNDGIEKGDTHHAAIVTGVMPDGEIKYTQHTDSHHDVSLEGRLPNTERAEGDQNIRIVRPHPDWY